MMRRQKNLKKNKKGIVRRIVLAYGAVSTIATAYSFIKARGLGHENDRILILKAMDRMRGDNIPADKTFRFKTATDDIELKVSYNPYIHLFANRLGSTAMVTPKTGEVFVDNTFRKMDDPIQRAFLAHELGHIVLRHSAGATYMLDRLKATYVDRKVLSIELEADEYAATIVSPWVMIAALKELGEQPFASKREILLRMKNINKKQYELYKKYEWNLHYMFNTHELYEWNWSIKKYPCNCRKMIQEFEDTIMFF